MSKNLHELYKDRLKTGALRIDAGQERAAKHLQVLYESLVTPGRRRLFKRKIENKQGAYLYGGVGRGKSMLMDLFYESLPADSPKRRVHFHAFMIEVHDYFHSRRADDQFVGAVDGLLPSLACVIAARSRVLCFDEFHVTDVADAMILGRLFTALFDAGLVVVLTSNWPPDELYKGGLQRDRFFPFIELLKNRLEIIHLDGGIDYRAQLLQTEGSYFTPLGEMTDRKTDEIFAHLTDHEIVLTDDLTVKGRMIPVYKTVRGVARFTFSQLCEQPHGAEDYLAIAHAYHTVFIENVPKMAYDRRNEARRFMMLIDVLYENRTRTIITAATTPDRLYYGDDYAFEFQRTVSRLLEMQSEAYLTKR
ncbi:MAG: cell division protein ZapE [Alphaproteobacteria bacterium]